MNTGYQLLGLLISQNDLGDGVSSHCFSKCRKILNSEISVYFRPECVILLFSPVLFIDVLIGNNLW